MILYQIILKEWRELFRNKIAAWLLSILLILSAFTLWRTSIQFRQIMSERNEAIGHMREKFTGQGAVNPHSAAHYGHYVYKPLNLLSIIDEGVNPFTGISLRLEAHQQHEAMFSPSQGSSSMIRFGELRLSLLLQVLLPLFILFVCYNAISQEKEKQTLKLSLAQGISLRQLIWGKILAYALLWWMVLLVNIALSWLIASVILKESFDPVRLGGLFVLYGTYYFIITSIAVYVSARSRTSGNALLTLLSAWLICTVLLPKATANIGENMTPLLTKLEMERRINEDNKNGINGHDPSNERTQRFKDSVLQKYKVNSVTKLPINLDGLTMQADEEYHNTVYDRHFGRVQQNIRKQNEVTAGSSFLNPFAAVRNLSKAVTGTDVEHHFDFTDKAETYRRFIIKTMNDEMAYGGSKTNDWDWSVQADYWHKIQDFKYVPPPMGWAIKRHGTELLALFLWLLLTIGIVHFTSNRLSIL